MLVHLYLSLVCSVLQLACVVLTLCTKGEVEHIALLKPKAQNESDDGMLEFLEDIIGSSQFKEPIEQLSKRVEELNEARGEKVCSTFVNMCC